MMTLIPLASSLLLLLLALANLISPGLAFWPPPGPNSWQKRLFIWLFRIMVYGLLIATAILLWNRTEGISLISSVIGGVLIVTGFSIGFYATFSLGWKNAFGDKQGLQTAGVFRFSRNPIYIATWFGLAGWGVIADDTLIYLTLASWSLLYLAAIFLEERWLAQQYGEEFQQWCKKVPRFF